MKKLIEKVIVFRKKGSVVFIVGYIEIFDHVLSIFGFVQSVDFHDLLSLATMLLG